MKKVFIGIDNGVSGSIGIITPDNTSFIKTPTFSQLKYTKKKQNVTRIDFNVLYNFLNEITKDYEAEEVSVMLERPMVNPKLFKASTSALRAWEATLICIEHLGFSWESIDSKEWQKAMLPSGVKGSTELKAASLSIGNRLFPQFKYVNAKDRDGILITEYLRRTHERY